MVQNPVTIHMYVDMCICMCVDMYMHMYVDMCVDTCVDMHIHMYVDMCVCMYVDMSTGRIGSRRQLAGGVSWGCSGGAQRPCGDHLNQIQLTFHGKSLF